MLVGLELHAVRC